MAVAIIIAIAKINDPDTIAKAANIVFVSLKEANKK
jgi:hypothetical protein